MRKILFTAIALLFAGGALMAQETPRWLRQNAISPNGEQIAFSYKGDIYVVNAKGGEARQITIHDSYETDPIWTAAGDSIIFSSFREGIKDIFIASNKGGIAKRLTNYPGGATPIAVLKDGTILFKTYFQYDTKFAGFPVLGQLYKTNTKGARPELVTSLPIQEISVADNGKVIYEDQKGYEDKFRKHHTSSVTRDIWEYIPASNSEKSAKAKKDARTDNFEINENGTFKKLTSFKGEDRQPVFAADGEHFYYLSEKDGKTSNIYKASLSDPNNGKQLTFAEKNPVRYLSVANNGLIAFSYNGDLYTLKEGGKPEKVEIKVYRDDIDKEIHKLNMLSGASSMSVSPDEKEVAVIIRGDVFVTSAEFKTTNRITNTASQERNICFSKDGRSLYYSAERDGHWGIYRTTLDKKEKNFAYALKMHEELFSDKGETCFQPKVSPDGKWVAYFRDRTEIVIKPTKGGKTKSLLKGANYSYVDGDLDFEWSPDSHYLLSSYQANGGWNHVDVALIDIESGDVTNLTESGYSDVNFKWVLDGKAMTWMSDKMGYRSHGSWGSDYDIYIMFFDAKTMNKFFKDKEDKAIESIFATKKEKKQEKKEEKKAEKDSLKNKVKKAELDLENRHLRKFRLTSLSGKLGDYYLSNSGDKLYYVARLEDGSRGLLVRDLQKGNIRVLQKGVSGTLVPSKNGNTLYVLSRGGISKLSLASGQSTRISFCGEYEFKPFAEREYIFDHVWKQVLEKFYDPEIHGVDWEYYKENYRQFLPYINNNQDFAELLSEMLGELNASHTGARAAVRVSSTLASLGVIYDNDWKGDGLKIKEIIPDGPISLCSSDIKEGDIIESISGTKIKAGENWNELLANKEGKKIAIAISHNGKKAKEYFVEPTRMSFERNKFYHRWVRHNEKTVERLSGGRVGYVHVRGMNSDSFREVYSKALGKYRNCDALIVDTRYNGGGWLHDDLATFLNGKAYLDFQPRGQFISTEPYSKWCKPSCVLICEANYSDASGFPYVYKTLGIGKLIGTPVPGTMTAVWWESQINPFIVFGIPQVGSYGYKEKRYLENLQVEPDILVYNDPASLLRGEDKQLEAAVKEMLKEADAAAENK